MSVRKNLHVGCKFGKADKDKLDFTFRLSTLYSEAFLAFEMLRESRFVSFRQYPFAKIIQLAWQMKLPPFI